jgi:hypothetical protein
MEVGGLSCHVEGFCNDEVKLSKWDSKLWGRFQNKIGARRILVGSLLNSCVSIGA